MQNLLPTMAPDQKLNRGVSSAISPPTPAEIFPQVEKTIMSRSCKDLDTTTMIIHVVLQNQRDVNFFSKNSRILTSGCFEKDYYVK